MAIQESRKAPDFTLRDQDGGDVSLKDFAGRNVILFFYPKDDTPGCTKEACGFRDLHDELDDADTVVLGVSPDGAESHRAFSAKFGLPFTLLSDLDKKVMDAELGVLPIDDVTLAQMKREKLAAKDRLVRLYDNQHH